MGQAIGGILPLAIGVAIGVLPIIAIILILRASPACPDARCPAVGRGDGQ